MGRLVEPKSAVVTADTPVSPAGPPAAKPEGHLERVAKYVPSEVVAGYVACITPLEAAKDGALRTILAWVAFVAGVIVTPVYLAKMARPHQPKRLQMKVSAVAFVVWAYALGGPFRFMGWHQPLVAAALLGIWTMTSGIFVPTAGDP